MDLTKGGFFIGTLMVLMKESTNSMSPGSN